MNKHASQFNFSKAMKFPFLAVDDLDSIYISIQWVHKAVPCLKPKKKITDLFFSQIIDNQKVVFPLLI